MPDPNTGEPTWLDQLPARSRALVAMSVGAVVCVIGLVLVATGDIGGDPDPTTTTTTMPPSTDTVSPTTEPTTTEPGPTFTVTIIPGDEGRLVGLDNPAGIDLTGADLTAAEVDDAEGQAPYMVAPVGGEDNGPSPQGQFRLICAASHWSPVDPVVHPGDPDTGHLHMFFGNTEAGATSTGETLAASGSSTCQGGPLNRSAYWMPAMLDGDGNTIVPVAITLYYKSHRPDEVTADAGVFPVGLQLLAGLEPGGQVNETFRASERLSWGCYNGSSAISLRNTIPGTSSPTCGSAPIQATLQFPQCVAVVDGEPVLESVDHVAHTLMLFNEAGNYGEQGRECPRSHPYRIPQVSYLVRWSAPADADTSDWRLSCDTLGTDGTATSPGGCLHADLLSAWSAPLNERWLAGCFAPTGPRNCSLGQTSTDRQLAPLSGRWLAGQILTPAAPRELTLP